MNRFSYFLLAIAALDCTPDPVIVPPAAPFGLQVVSGQLGSSRAIQVRGSAEPGVSIELFLDANCGNVAITGTSEAFQGGGLAVTVPANQVTQLTARAVREGVSSACSLPVSFTHDDLAPAAPVLTTLTAVAGGSMPRVVINGTTESGTRVFVFTNASCTPGDERAASVTMTDFTVELAARANDTTEFTALAIDAAGNRSPCSATSLQYTHDGQPPAPPVLSGFTPAGPSSNAMPTLTGTAEPGATLRFFRDASCATSLAGSAIADATGAFSVQLTVPLNATTTVRAIAVDASLNTSSCASGPSYVHDDVAPAAPSFSATTPSSPSRTATSFTVPVTAEAGSIVELFTVAGCTGAPAMILPAPATFTIPVTPNTRQVLAARARDVAGNVSACASSAVEHDDVPPAVATWTGSVPTSPTNQVPNFSLSGSGEAGATATLYRSVDCTTLATTTTVSGAGAFSFTRTISNNTTQRFTVTLTDAAGNVSSCSPPFALTHDNVAPIMPVVWGTLPPSPSSVTGPVRFAGVAESGSTVRLYASSSCAGLPNTTTTVGDLISGSNNQGHFAASTTPVLGGTLQLFALAVDAAGNSSPCSTTSATFEQRATSAWGDEVTVGTVAPSGGFFMFPSVVLQPSGEATALWIRTQLLTSGVVTSTFSSGAWSTPTEFASTGSFVDPPNLVSDASGTVLAGWTQSSNVWAARRSPAGAWAAENLGTTSYGRTPAVALDGSGNGVFVSERFVTSTVRILARRSTGATWGPEASVSDSNYSSFGARAAMNSSGRVVIVYARNRGSGTAPIDELFSVTGELASGWGAPVQRSNAMISRDDISLDLTASGDALATWLQYPTYNSPMTPMVAQSNGTTWTAARALTVTTTNRPALASRAFANGEAIATWTSTAGTLMVARRSAAGVWGAATAVPGATNAYEVRLAAEPGGKVALAWETGEGNPVSKNFWFSTLGAGGAWSAPQLLDVGCTTNDSLGLTIDAQGRMVAVWTKTNSTESRLMARRLD